MVRIDIDGDGDVFGEGQFVEGFADEVAQAHDGMAGVYGAVMAEGMLHRGDPVEVLD